MSFRPSLAVQSNSNADTKAWLQGQNPCPPAGSVVQNPTNMTQNPAVQFAYFYLAGYGAHGANGYLSGYFIDPALMPVVP